jgi:transposase
MLSVVTSGLATTRDVAAAFGLHENTVQRLVRQWLGAVVPAKPGPKRKRKLRPAALERIAKGSEHSLRSRQIQSWLQTDHGMVLLGGKRQVGAPRTTGTHRAARAG